MAQDPVKKKDELPDVLSQAEAPSRDHESWAGERSCHSLTSGPRWPTEGPALTEVCSGRVTTCHLY
jgi:hypothetical protein